jgi:hypothetical protein
MSVECISVNPVINEGREMAAHLGSIAKQMQNALSVRTGRSICAHWSTKGVEQNWGDNLNPYLVEKLSGAGVLHSRDVYVPWVKEVFGVVGSWIANIRQPNLAVWGLGFISHQGQIGTPPKRVLAVRGPRTLQKLKEQGFDTEAVIGDPALLIPLLFQPKREARKDVAVIPHHRDRGLPIFEAFRSRDGYKVLDICTNIEEFCQQLASCQAVVSSSLHAVVAAHAYKMPAYFIKVSDNPLGDGFKLLDYLGSVGLDDAKPIECREPAGILKAIDAARLPRFYPDMEGLLRVCPFLSESLKGNLLSQAAQHYRLA